MRSRRLHSRQLRSTQVNAAEGYIPKVKRMRAAEKGKKKDE